MLSRPFVTGINHLLKQEPWAADLLRPHVGRRLRLRVLPFPDLVVCIGKAGLFEVPDHAAPAPYDLEIAMPLAAATTFLRHPGRAPESADIKGDAELAQVIQRLVRDLRWDIEDDLARVIGDVPAHRLVRTGQALAAWQRDAGERLAHNIAEYLIEERPTLARGGEVRELNAATNDTRDAVERLDKRIERLARLIADKADTVAKVTSSR